MFAAVREDLIWEDIAEDHKNVGLVYIAGAIPADADAEPTAADIEISPAASRKLQIFLSYGHDSTTPLAERLKAYLEGERKHEVWLDCMELTPGDKWEARIEDMLDRVAAHEQGRSTSERSAWRASSR